jgi:hypothetical protein
MLMGTAIVKHAGLCHVVMKILLENLAVHSSTATMLGGSQSASIVMLSEIRAPLSELSVTGARYYS